MNERSTKWGLDPPVNNNTPGSGHWNMYHSMNPTDLITLTLLTYTIVMALSTEVGEFG